MTQSFIVKLIADGTIIPIVLITGYALLFLVPKKGRFEIYARIVVAGMTTYLVAKLLASVYQPVGERPFELLGTAPGALYLNNPGFPSDHALFASFLTFTVWYVTRRKDLTIILAILTLLMCVGRVVALVHTPLDIAGGIAVAAIGSLWLVQANLPKLHQPLAKKTKS